MDVQRIVGYLDTLGLTYEDVGDNTWVVQDEDKGLQNVVVVYEDPIVIIRVKVTEVPLEGKCAFFEELLRLNASEMVHGAYGLDGDSIIVLNTLVSQTMDLEELQASLDSISLSVAQHYQVLSKFVPHRKET